MCSSDLLSGHFPGDPNDKPTPAEIIKAREKFADFQNYRRGYPWKPFARVERPTVPQVKNAAWVRNPIDAFIAARLPAGLTVAPAADARTFVHRATFDLTGLPPTPQETELAELLTSLVPSIEMLRLVSSGTEATMSALRLARGFTGRSTIVKFEGCYHGHGDALLVKAG